MVLPLAWITQYCRLRLLLPFWVLGPQGSQGRYFQNPKKSMEEQTSSSVGGKMRSPAREPWPHHKAELTQAEELLEQQLEVYQALLEGQEGAWEAQALVLKIQKLKEQMKRHQENLRGHA
ncbi:mitochondrial coiled-coil domain protein 1 [Urocitellus parryii]|uniref:Mitochondrial coiled-coil domain 1 n=1 Tax=Urocitellus parryii TaxID=9999 RepID=A0A8D2IH77_UROPR|nr:mitochondrial coiled-coil domain protein 1 [Urocitellus parryii]